MARVGTVTADFIARTAGFEEGTRRARSALGGFERQAANTKRVLAGLFAGVSVAGLVGSLRQVVAEGDKIAKLSVRLGATTEALSQLDYVAQRSGVSFETLTMGLQRLTRRVSEAAQGSGEAVGALDELGLSAQRLAQLRPEQQLLAVTQAMDGVTNAGDRVRIAMKLFDSEGVALIQTMEQGAAGLEAMMQEADRLGLTLDQETTSAMVQATDQMAIMDANTKALSITLAQQLVPALNAILEGMNKIAGPVGAFVSARILEWRRTAQWFAAAKVGDISWWDWAIGNDAEAKRLEEAGKLSTSLREGARSGPQTSLIGLPDVSGRTLGQARGGGGGGRAARRGGGVARTIRGVSEAQQELNRTMEEGKRLAESLRTPVEIYADSMSRLHELLGAGAISQETFNRAVQQYQEELHKATTKIEETNDFARELGMTFSSAFEEAIVEGKNLRDVLKGIEQDIIRIITRKLVTEPLANAIGGAFGGGGLLGGLFGSLFGGARAGGGPVSAGSAYLVGERGPELFIPDSNGRVMANGDGINIVLNLGDSAPRARESATQIATAVGRAVTRALGRNN